MEMEGQREETERVMIPIVLFSFPSVEGGGSNSSGMFRLGEKWEEEEREE